MAGMRVQTEVVLGVVVIRVEGRMDAVATPSLAKKCAGHVNEGCTQIVLDCAKMEYLSSAGIRLLLSLTKELKGKTTGLHLCSVSDGVMAIIKMAGFERVLRIFPTEHEALKAFPQPS